jgi:hypothetical protein
MVHRELKAGRLIENVPRELEVIEAIWRRKMR